MSVLLSELFIRMYVLSINGGPKRIKYIKIGCICKLKPTAVSVNIKEYMMNEVPFLIIIPAFSAGWLASEIYRFYKDRKERRWRR